VPVDLPDSRDQTHPCRPTVSCTADFVAPGRFEAELGGLYSSVAGGAAHVLSFPVLLKQTFTRLLQLQVGSNGYTVVDDTARYFDNVFVGPKLHLVDQGDVIPSLAISAVVSLPTFRADGYTRYDDVFVTGYASKDVAFIHGDYNAGALVWRVEGSALTQAFTSLAISPSLPAPFGATIEGYFFTDAAPVAPRDGGIRLALGLTARPWLAVDAGGDAGFFPSTRAYSLFLGATIIPAVFYRSE
jgi:hypothetical protein